MEGIGNKTSTTPTGGRFHGARPARGLQNVSGSQAVTGRFGRMFRNLPVFDQDEGELRALGQTMIQQLETPFDKDLGVDDDDENKEIPAGYTYLGQFIDHDITFDPVSSLQRQNDPDALIDFRTPRFDLDSIYGRGPADQPYLYEPDGLHFILGNAVSNNKEFAGPDLQRTTRGRAIIGDPRNDENLIVSQLHALFLRFHNKMADTVASEATAAGTKLDNDDLFKETQRRVRWHYQWIVINDLLPRIIGGALANGQGRKVVQSLLNAQTFETVSGDGGKPLTLTTCRPQLLFFDLNNPPFMPVEFSVAAYRFGHSMVRPSYFFNDFVREQLAKSRTKDGLFRTKVFTDDFNPKTLLNLNGFRPLPPEWGFQWKYFYEVAGRGANLPQPSYKIDHELANPLGRLPDKVQAGDQPFSLAERNLLRGRALGLPSGEAVALAMGIEPLSPKQLEITQPSLIENTPLWYYVLKEAEVLCGAHHLGPVGARIVAETLIGLLWGDPLSYLRVQPTWKPELASKDGTFGMPELIAFTG